MTAAAFGLWGFLVARGSGVPSTGELLATALRREHRTHDWVEQQYSRLPPAIRERLPVRLHPWDVERGWAVEELKSLTNQSAEIVPRLLDALRSARLSPDEIDLFESVIVHHSQLAEMSLPVLLSRAATNLESDTTQIFPAAQLAPAHPKVFQLISNQLVHVLLGPANVGTSSVQQTRLDNWRRNVLLSFAHLEGHTGERSNLLERLLAETQGTRRVELASAYRHYRFPPREQARVLERLSRDRDDWIQRAALEGLTYHSHANEVSLQIAVKRVNEILYDDAEPAQLRAFAASVSHWLGGEMSRVAPGVAYWLRTEDDFDGCGFAAVVEIITRAGFELPGVAERLVEAARNPQSPRAAEYCLAAWYRTLDTAVTLSRLVEVMATFQGDEQLSAARAANMILAHANPSPFAHVLTPSDVQSVRARERAVVSFLENHSQFAPFLNSLKTTLEQQPPEFHRVMGRSLQEFIRRHEAVAK